MNNSQSSDNPHELNTLSEQDDLPVEGVHQVVQGNERSQRDSERNWHDRHVVVGQDVVESTIVTGDRNVVGNHNLVVHGNYVQASSTPRSPSEQKLFNQVKAEVASRLRQSLHNKIFIELNKEDQPQQVIRIGDAEVKVGKRSPEALSTDTTILQVFDRPDIGGKLLILGKPGAGKTTTQLELAKALVERGEQNLNAPTPVLFNLSSWRDERQSIKDWLVAELKSKYGVRRDIGEKWLKECRLLPVLDGLDELKSQRQEACVHALNQFISGENAPLQVVVCSRLEEYERLGLQLQLNGAICLRELTDNQIHAYLTSTHQQDLWQLLYQDAALLALLRTPLLLGITVLAYQQNSLEQWKTFQTSQERLQALLDAFIQGQLEQIPRTASNKTSKGYTRQQMRRWLSWLAQQLERESQTEFLIERMQPSWLESQELVVSYRHKSRLFLALIFGLIFGLSFGIAGGIDSGLIQRFVGGLIGGLAGGMRVGDMLDLGRISVAESLTWSWRVAKKELCKGSLLGLILGLVIGLISVLSGEPSAISELTVVLISGLILGLLFGLISVLNGGLGGSEVEQKNFSNQGIWRTLRIHVIYIIIFILIGALIGVLVGGLIGMLTGTLLFGMLSGLMLGLVLGLVGKLNGGVANCVKHIALRVVLHRNRYIPWNYARFLDYCTDRLLLQRVGGRYRFMHKLLQEHFAAMPFEKP